MEATIIHLSDLHFKNDVENRFRIKCLREDLARLQQAGPTFTAFTGDLIQAGDHNTYDVLFDELIGPLLELGHEIGVIPGNHDIQRAVASVEAADAFLADRGSSYLFNGSRPRKSPHEKKECDPLSNYRSFEDLFAPYSMRSYWGYLRNIGSLSVIGLNSTWLSCDRGPEISDRGKLRIEPHVLDLLTKSLPDENLKVVLLHHPLDWLEETTRDAVTKLITERTDLALFGHVHTGDLSNLARGDSNCLFIQSPPLRADWSKGTNGYAIIKCNLENKKFEIDYRSYSKTRREFVKGEDFAKEGFRYPRPEDRSFFASTPSESTLFQRFIDGAPYDFTDWHRNNIRSKTKRLGTFIIPKAKRVHEDPEEQWKYPSDPIDKIVRSSARDQFFVAPLDAGSTTAAYLAFKHLAETFAAHEKIPAFFDASEQKINKASILRAINKSSLVTYTHQEALILATAGLVSLVVDGLSLADVEQFNLFRETVAKFFPKIRIICFLSTEKRGFSQSGASSVNLYMAEDEIFEFVQLEVADIRSMVDVWRPNISSDLLDAAVTQVVDSFRQMDEPIFASSIAVVVETLSQDPDFKPLNKSRLLERYVECLLGRFELEDVREGTFASSDKIDLLSFVARRLLESGELGMSEKQLDEIFDAYQKKYLIELPKRLLEEFIEKGLFTLSEGQITFRADYLFSFFVARHMKSDPQFAASIFDGDGMFKHNREIVFYGELEGTDTRTVLNSVREIADEVQQVLHSNYLEEGISLLGEWEAACNDNAVSQDELADATGLLAEVTPSPEHADRESDSQLTQVKRRRGIARRTTVQEAEAKLLVIMKLYALLLKNALQIPAEDKLLHLRTLYQAGELWVGFLCARRAEIGAQPTVIAGGIRFINLGASIDKEKSLKEFKFNAPNSLSRILADAIRNPQLAVALRQVLPELTPMGSLFARDALLSMSGIENREHYVTNLLNEENVNLITCSLRTLRSRFLASGRNKEQRGHMEAVVGQLEKTRLPALSGNFDRLRKARLVRDLKENAHSKKAPDRKY